MNNVRQTLYSISLHFAFIQESQIISEETVDATHNENTLGSNATTNTLPIPVKSKYDYTYSLDQRQQMGSKFDYILNLQCSSVEYAVKNSNSPKV